MSEKDAVSKKYMEDNATFADAFNFLMFDGEQIIRPETLKPLDTTAIAMPFGENSKASSVQKYRDVLKFMTAKTDDKTAYLILGIENQSEIHHAMPVRTMLYDAIQYTNQVEMTAKQHRKENRKPETHAEFLSGFHSTDRLIPVVTLVIYFGAKQWNAPKSLHEMLTTNDEKILKFVPDYRLNLIAPAEIPDEDFSKFSTELSLAMKYIKYSNDKIRLKQLVQEDESYKSVSRRTADMVNVMTNSNLQYVKREERVDMCEAIRGMLEDSKIEGLQTGIRTANEAVVRSMLKHGLTAEQIAEYTEISPEEIQSIIDSDK